MDRKPRANNAIGFWIETKSAAFPTVPWRGITNIVDTRTEAEAMLPQCVASAEPGYECRINEALKGQERTGAHQPGNMKGMK